MNLRVFVLGLAVITLVTGTVMSWEQSRMQAAEARTTITTKASAVTTTSNITTTSTTATTVNSTVIPEDAIRLRILANSDRAQDQIIKRAVRDRIVEVMNGWLAADDSQGQAKQPQTRAEARELITANMEQLDEAASEVLQSYNVSYTAKLELKVVPFPAKWYGGQAYPAGDYEALRITLGTGEGQNWWCVLFPPLCFIDGDTAQAKSSESEQTNNNKSESATAKESDSASNGSHNADNFDHSNNSGQTQEVRFFLWDLIASFFTLVGDLLKALFG
ncbi:stage II sporulation protein R [Paenibacillus sp. 481]|uniref:stage II sporulation protein R n=1 Tax=Paenibacillus sp. 481 TaxID=2835869 RepID=UPI001E4205D1|nr:stage II sporulation protein R [Paenibacillus sp. 481]UHA75647.1 stage II sporulation protein R [Paenibacillus sp. 481]